MKNNFYRNIAIKFVQRNEVLFNYPLNERSSIPVPIHVGKA